MTKTITKSPEETLLCIKEELLGIEKPNIAFQGKAKESKIEKFNEAKNIITEQRIKHCIKGAHRGKNDFYYNCVKSLNKLNSVCPTPQLSLLDVLISRKYNALS